MGERIKVAVSGAGGRMGSQVVAMILSDPLLVLAAALEREGHEWAGRDAGPLLGLSPCGVRITCDPGGAIPGAEVLVDFSTPAALVSHLDICIEKGIPMVSGVTGLDPVEERKIEEASGSIPILHSPNMSFGVNLLYLLVETASEMCGQDFTPIVLEMHHRAKKDAPSGTARRIAGIIEGRRGEGDIGVLSGRGGTITGEHRVIFAGDGERVELAHIAEDRSIFARGAIRAVKFIKGKAPGLYTMEDLFRSILEGRR